MILRLHDAMFVSGRIGHSPHYFSKKEDNKIHKTWKRAT